MGCFPAWRGLLGNGSGVIGFGYLEFTSIANFCFISCDLFLYLVKLVIMPLHDILTDDRSPLAYYDGLTLVKTLEVHRLA